MVDRAVPPPVAPAPVPPVKDTATDPRAKLDVADHNAPCVAEGWAPAGNASTFDPAWDAANDPAIAPRITPLIMAGVCSR